MPSSFTAQIQRFIEKTKRKERSVVSKTIIGLGSEIIRRTPIGDPESWVWPPPPGYIPGTLINSYRSSIGSKDHGGVRLPNASASASKRQLIIMARKASGSIFYMANNAHYAMNIEYGWSKQAPQGMVRLAVLNIRKHIRGAL